MPNEADQTEEVRAQWAYRASLLRAMAHPIRLMILDALCKGPRCVNDINALLSEVSQPNLSQHIGALRRAELVACHTNGPLRCYYILKPTLVEELMPLLCGDHPTHQRPREIVVREANENLETTGTS